MTSVAGEGEMAGVAMNALFAAALHEIRPLFCRFGNSRVSTWIASRPFWGAVAFALVASEGVHVGAISHGAEPKKPEAAWTSLFNGKDLSDWEKWVVPSGRDKPMYGVNQDPVGVFTVGTVDGKPAIHVSGELYGGISTLSEWTNFHARVEFKWGERKFAPRNGPRHYRDSGLLYWCIGPHGASSGRNPWLRSVECNIMEKSTGQWWSVDGAYCNSEAFLLTLDRAPWVPYRGEEDGETCYVYQPGFPNIPIMDGGVTASVDYEKPHGEWNVCEVIAWGNACIHLLNGGEIGRAHV